MQPDNTFANLQDDLKEEILRLRNTYCLFEQYSGANSGHPNFEKLIDLVGKMNAMTQTDTGETAMTSQTLDRAITILDTLTQQVNEQVGQYSMDTGLADAMHNAKQFLIQQDSTSSITFEVIAEEWSFEDAASTETEPFTFGVSMPTRNAFKLWDNQTRWNLPEVGDNFATVLEGPFQKLATLVLDTILDEQNIKIRAYSSMVATKIAE